MRTSGKKEAGKVKKLGRPPLPSSFSEAPRRALPSRSPLSALLLLFAIVWPVSSGFGQSVAIPATGADSQARADVAQLAYRFDVRDYGAAAEIRQQIKELGLTPMSRRSLQWEIEKGEQASERTSTRRNESGPRRAGGPDPRLSQATG